MSAVFQDINKGESVTAGHCPIHFLGMFSHIVDVGGRLAIPSQSQMWHALK
jgi:hypothetical protein